MRVLLAAALALSVAVVVRRAAVVGLADVRVAGVLLSQLGLTSGR